MTAIDFSGYIAEKTKDFVGREWVFEAIAKWLAGPSAPRFFIITGEPGIGKTAIAAQLTQLYDLSAYHFCIARQTSTTDPLNFTRSISLQLCELEGFTQEILEGHSIEIDVSQQIQGNPGEVIGIKIENLIIGARSSIEAFNRIVLSPLRGLYANGFNQSLVIVVDALDEAAQFPGQETIIDLLANLEDLPSQLRFIITSRPDNMALRHFKHLGIPYFLLDAKRDENTIDARAFIRQEVERSESITQQIQAVELDLDVFVEQLAQASRGNFLYLVWVLAGIEARTFSLHDVGTLPTDLAGIYREYLRTRKIGNNIEQWRQTYRPVLGVLSVAQGPLTSEQVANFSALPKQGVKDILLDLGQFLQPTLYEEGQYLLYHQSVIDFLSDETLAKEYWIDLISIHEQIVDYCLKVYSNKWESADPYVLANLPAHMARGNRLQDLQSLIENKDWFKAKLAIDSSQMSYLSDLDLAFQSSMHTGKDAWPHLSANTFIRATLTNVARYLPVEIIEALARLGREAEALRWAEALPEEPQKYRTLSCIEIALRDVGKKTLADQVREEIKRLSVEIIPTEQLEQPDQWLVNLVEQFGTEFALREFSINPSDSDESENSKRIFEIALAAHKAGKDQDSYQMLQRCLDTSVRDWDWHQRELLPQIAKLLILLNQEQDILRVFEIALDIDLEPHRVSTCAELALLCSTAQDEAIRTQALAYAVEQVEQAKHTHTLQFELGKIALAMAKMGDSRANEFLEDALMRARQPHQPAWAWEERESWGIVASALTSIGFFDQSVELIKNCNNTDRELIQIVKSLAINDRWEQVLRVVQSLHSVLQRSALAHTAHELMNLGKLTAIQYEFICTHLETSLSAEKQPREKLEILNQLLGVVLKRADRIKQAKYFSMYFDELGKLEVSKAKADSLINICAIINDATEYSVVEELNKVAQAVEEDQFLSRSNALYAVGTAFTKIGQYDEAWALTLDIEADKRLQLQLDILEMARSRESLNGLDQRFGQALETAKSLENRNRLPTHWGRLAVFANELKRASEMEECINNAIEGSIRVHPVSHVSFNIFNCALIARDLHKLGRTAQTRLLLETGIDYLESPEINIDPFCRIARVIVGIQAKGLLEREFQAALRIEKANQKAEALFGITYSMTQTGEIDLAQQYFPQVVEAVKVVHKNQFLVRDFGLLLIDVFGTDSIAINEYVVDLLRYVRLRDRPVAITWIASLLPAFAKVDTKLARSTWERLLRVDEMFSSSR